MDFTLGSRTTAQWQQRYYGIDATGEPYGAPKTLQLKLGATALVDREMTYDSTGNVLSVLDRANGNEQSNYSYDELDRLTNAVGPASESLAYDQVGNIATRNGLAYSYDLAHKHAVASYNGLAYSYDANGSMVGRGTQSVVYDADNRPAQVDTADTGPCTFAYDGDGKRLKRSDASGTVHYVGAYEKNVTSGEATKYYVAGLGGLSRLIGFRKGSALRFVGTDHLGSTVLTTDASFVAVGMRIPSLALAGTPVKQSAGGVRSLPGSAPSHCCALVDSAGSAFR